jgi:NADH dehydrogenase FAD-containing subunit
MEQNRVVVVGGGIAGHRVAFALQHAAAVTLIDPKDFFEVPMAAPRLLVDPDSLPALIPYRVFLPKVNLVRGWAVEVEAGHIQVRNSESTISSIPYDYLILATGSVCDQDLVKPLEGTVNQRRARYDTAYNLIATAKQVLIVGGGPIGVEVAGEITEERPGKPVTLVEAGPRLLPATSERLGRWAQDFLTARGVTVILGERIMAEDAPGGIEKATKSAVTQFGRRIAYDLLLRCVGMRPDASYLRRNFPNAVDEAGYVKVDSYLRIPGQTRIFAMGDMTNLAETKLGMRASQHAKVVAENILRLMRNPKAAESALRTYRPATGNQTMLITLGRRNGVMHLPFGEFRNGWMARLFKSRDMLVPFVRKAIGLPKQSHAPGDV